MPTQAGRLDKRVTVQERSTVQDPDTGEVREEWADLFTLWMDRRDSRRIDAAPGQERFAANQKLAEADATFQCRRSSATLEIWPDTHRLIHKGRIYEIQGVADLGRAEARVEIACTVRTEKRFGE